MKVGIRQRRVLDIMVRNQNRWPEGWTIPRGMDREAMASLVEQGFVESMPNPVLTRQGMKLVASLF